MFWENVVSNMLLQHRIMNHSCHRQSDFHLISWPWRYVCRSISWSSFSVRHWLSSFILFSSYSMTALWIRLQRSLWDQFLWPKRGFMTANTTSRNSMYIDLCQYCLTASEGVLRFICCPQNCLICPSSYFKQTKPMICQKFFIVVKSLSLTSYFYPSPDI